MSRGRGRGRSSTAALASSMGLQMNQLPILQQGSHPVAPPPIYRALLRHPLPMESTEESEYMAQLSQELLNRFKESPQFLSNSSPKRDIRRYTDKYKPKREKNWEPDWSRIPKELHWKTKRSATNNAQPVCKKRKTNDITSEMGSRLTELERREAGEEGVKKSEETEEKPEEEEIVSDDDLQEEDNDYIESYFDNGENFLDASDDNLDEDAVF